MFHAANGRKFSMAPLDPRRASKGKLFVCAGNSARLFVNEVKVSTYQGTTCLCNLKLADVGESELMLLMIVPRELAGRMTQTQTAQSASKSAIGMAEMLAHEIKTAGRYHWRCTAFVNGALLQRP